MPNRRTRNIKNRKKKSRKRKGGRPPKPGEITPSSPLYKAYVASKEKQRKRQIWRKDAEKNFNYGTTSIPLNPHIPFHLGKKIGKYKKGDGYYQDTNDPIKGYCYVSDGTPDENKDMTKFANVGNENDEFCCGMGEVQAYDGKGNLMKYEDGDIVTIPAPKIPNTLTQSCDDPMNFTNTLCSGGEVFLKQHNKNLCCPLGQTPDTVNGECREDLNNKHPEVVAKRVKRIADKTGVTKVAATAVKGATIVAAGGVGACFVFPPCAAVLAIAICIGLGISALKMKNFVKDKNKLQEIVDNGHELLARLGEIQANAEGKYKKEDSMKAAGLLARISDCSRKLVKQPSDIGDDYMAQLVGKVPILKKKYKGMGPMKKLLSVEKKILKKGHVLETKTGLIVGEITDCCDEGGNSLPCGKNTHVKVTYVPRPDNLKQTLLRSQGNNANNVRLITAWDKTFEHSTELQTLKGKTNYTPKEFEDLLKLSPAQGKDKILDKNTLSSRGGTGFTKIIKQLYAGKGAVRKYNNAMKEIQVLIDEIDKTEKENEELAKSITESKEKVSAMFKKAVTKIKALSGFGALGKKGSKWKQEQIYPITFNGPADFDRACSKFAKPADGGRRRKSRKKRLRKSRRKSRHKRRKKSRHKRRKKSRRRRRR